MPKIYSKDVVLIKRKRGKFFVLFVGFVICLMLFVFVGGLLSNLLGGNGFVLGFLKRYDIDVNAFNFYAVTMGESESVEELEKISQGVAVLGASGFVWKGDVNYVIGNMYFNESDANNVKNNIKVENYNVDVFKIKGKKVRFNIGNIAKSDKKSIENDIKYIVSVGRQVYEISNKLDTSETTYLNVCSFINSIRGEVKLKINDLFRFYTNYASSEIFKIYQSYLLLDNSLESCVELLLTNTSNGHNLKYCLSEIVRIYYDLTQKFA